MSNLGLFAILHLITSGLSQLSGPTTHQPVKCHLYRPINNSVESLMIQHIFSPVLGADTGQPTYVVDLCLATRATSYFIWRCRI